MQIRIDKDYKILKKSDTINLPNFTVLTGENGSGKSQLLRWIRLVCIGQTYDNLDNNVDFSDPETSETIKGLVCKDDTSRFSKVVSTYPGISPENLEEINNSYSILNSLIQNWAQLKYTANACSLIPDLTVSNIAQHVGNVNNIAQEFIRSGIVQNNQYSPPSFNYIHEHNIRQVLNIALKAKKKLTELTIIDSIIFYEIQNSQIIEPNIEILFHQFELKRKYYPDFVEGVKPPIEILNEILASANFKYRAEYNFTHGELQLSPIILLDTTNGNKITPNNLSSGEKTIMSLMTALYNSNTQGAFPDLILYDEPDAFLHPSLAQMMLNVMQNVIVEDNGVCVIMTTHSPTTVAISSEETLFKMNRELGYPQKIDQNEAINSLIFGIKGLIVSQSNRRQVFVESDYDVEYYEGIYNLLKKRLRSNIIQLNFISSGKTKIDSNGDEIATCERVKNITSVMRSYNNKQIFGIIDWDLKNKLTEGITMLGHGKRYSIENFLLDPILIGLILQRESHLTFEEMGILGKTYGQLLSFTEDDYQKISDFVMLKISDLKNNVTTCNHTDIEEHELINGIKIKIPKWFLYYQGHSLETDLLTKFPKLKEIKKGKETGLKLAIINKLLKDNPEIMSKDFLTMFEFLHSN